MVDCINIVTERIGTRLLSWPGGSFCQIRQLLVKFCALRQALFASLVPFIGGSLLSLCFNQAAKAQLEPGNYTYATANVTPALGFSSISGAGAQCLNSYRSQYLQDISDLSVYSCDTTANPYSTIQSELLDHGFEIAYNFLNIGEERRQGFEIKLANHNYQYPNRKLLDFSLHWQVYFEHDFYGFFRVGIPEHKNFDIAVMPPLPDGMLAISLYGLANFSSVQRYFGHGYAPKTLRLIAEPMDTIHFSFVSHYWYGLRWQLNYAQPGNYEYAPLSQRSHHLTLVGSHTYYDSILQFTSRHSIKLASRYRNTRSAIGRYVPIPIGVQIGAQYDIDQFNFGLIGSYDVNSNDAISGPDQCGQFRQLVANQCGDRWQLAAFLGYNFEDPAVELMLHLIYSRAEGTIKRDRLLASLAGGRLTRADTAADNYAAVRLFFSIPINDSISIFSYFGYEYDDVATAASSSEAAANKYGSYADATALSFVIGSKLEF